KTPSLDEDDPFGDSGVNLGEDDFGLEEEPKSEEKTPSLDDDDPFGAEDPFGSTGIDANDDAFGEEKTTEATSIVDEDDPFADNSSLDDASDVDSFEDQESKLEDEDDPFAQFDKTIENISNGVTTDSDDDSMETDIHDPFQDFDASEFSGKESESEISDVGNTSDLIGNSLDEINHDDFEGTIGDSISDIDQEPGMEEDESSTEKIDEELSDLAEEGGLAEAEELTDEELGIIQQELINYPPKLKRTLIDAIVNDKLSPKAQRDLLDLIKHSQKPEVVADYLSNQLGYPVELYDGSGVYSERGIPVIASKPIYTKEGEFRRRQLIKRTAAIVLLAFLGTISLFSLYKYVLIPVRAAHQYDLGLEEIKLASQERKNSAEESKHFANAEMYFQKGEKVKPYSIKYLNRYGIAYMKAGAYDRAFEKLFGKVVPDFGDEQAGNREKTAWATREEIPIISLGRNSSWDISKIPSDEKNIQELEVMKLTAQDKTERKIVKAGAYIVSRLGYNVHDVETYINLAKFHSNISRSFVQPMSGKSYKNDRLAISYYKSVLTDAEEPNNIQALSGLAKVYYNEKEFSKAVAYYNKIVEKFPKNPIGHGGLLSSFIEMWKEKKDPQFVMDHHRKLKNPLGIEEDLSLYTLSKLASFYIDLDENEVRIQYNLNPEDRVTGMGIDQTIERLLDIAFQKKEINEEGLEIQGSEFAEAYYQRGRYFIKRAKERYRALKQFELAANYDTKHYLAVLEMAEYYIRMGDKNEAERLLAEALDRYKQFKDDYGNREADETLIEGDPGRIYFDKAKIIYFGSALRTKDGKIYEFPGRKVYPDRAYKDDYMGTSSIDDIFNRQNDLKNSYKIFEKSLELNLSPSLRRETHYYMGWIEYMGAKWEDALEKWSNLDENDFYSNINVMMGRANSYYYMDQLNASLGNYLKIKDDFEEKANKISSPLPQDVYHQEIYQVLAAVYNNIGAVYERKDQKDQALKYYWKAIETSKRINNANEIANYNKEMIFKNRGDKLPLLDDWLSPTIDSIREATQ
ncbi:MAG: tetratricopeptide repeat protein, partial [Leptospiraceae bacterium]|nr:tetratricopeptide repeat protein [Leptospiraceae bacterium]